MGLVDALARDLDLMIEGLFNPFKGTKKSGGGGGGSGGYRPQPQQQRFGSNKGSTGPNKKKKPVMSNYTMEGLNRMMTNSKKARESYSGIKTGYTPKKNINFSGLK